VIDDCRLGSRVALIRSGSVEREGIANLKLLIANRQNRWGAFGPQGVNAHEIRKIGKLVFQYETALRDAFYKYHHR
jgi:hypothetical protein